MTSEPQGTRRFLLFCLLAVVACAHAPLSASSATASRPVRSPTDRATAMAREILEGLEPPVVECSNRECFRKESQACRAAHLLEAFFTIEGTPAFIDYFVVGVPAPGERGCRVLVLADYTRDYWGRCSLKKETCPTFEAATSEFADDRGCSPAEIVLKAEPCQMPD